MFQKSSGRKWKRPENDCSNHLDKQCYPQPGWVEHDGHEAIFRERTGLVVDAYFSATKIRWILDQEPALQARAEAGELAFGTIDSWLLWNLTGGTAAKGAVHLTEPTNACRTLVYNIHEHCWDTQLLRLLNMPAALLPQIQSSSSMFGQTVALQGIPVGTPISGMAGDQQAALYGHGCWQAGEAKNTYGTGAPMVYALKSVNESL